MPEGECVDGSHDNLLLRASNVNKHFGGITALADVSFELKKGSINSLIGPNGAGKTTFINVVTGVHAPDSGEILFKGENIAGLPAHTIASKGIGRTFQLEELFAGLSVMENTLVGCHTQSSSGMLACGFSLPRARKEEKRLREIAIENLTFVGLEKRAQDPISKLPLGERKLVGVARALSMNPTLLMLDEPAGGLAAHEAKRLVDLIYMLVGKGLTIFIVEHNMPFVMSLSEQIIVLDEGTKIAEGPPEDVRANREVIRAYLGEEV
jgi:branched-chain amino acid transport system ATP-binding protein